MKLQEAFNFYFNDKIDFRIFNNLIVKDNIKEIKNKKKTFFSTSDELKLVQRFLSKFIFDSLGVREDIVFSYRKGVNVLDCIEPHRYSDFIYKTDIENFFPSITSLAIKRKIKSSIGNVNYIDSDDVINNIDRILDLTTINGRLPIGFVSSPSISNFIMNDFDCCIYEYAVRKKQIYTRYADDIIISGEHEIDKDETTSVISNIISSQKDIYFKLNKKKTKIITKKYERNIFGVSISPIGGLTVSSKLKKEIEVKIFYLINDREKFSLVSKMDEKNAILSLSGSLSYVLGVDPDYVTKLRRKYGNAIINKILVNKGDL